VQLTEADQNNAPRLPGMTPNMPSGTPFTLPPAGARK
jgi:hypothetical protein